MATILDIAAATGLSKQTVSQILNTRRSGRYAAETVDRVMRCAEELGYRPSAAARATAGRSLQMIGVLVRNERENALYNVAAFEIILGINLQLEQAGYAVSLVRLSDLRDGHGFASRAFREQMLDGMIVVDDLPEEIVGQVERFIPRCVWVDSNVWRDVNCVRRDEHHAGFTVGSELIRLGHREITWLQLQGGSHGTSARLQGLRAGVREAGLDPASAISIQRVAWDEAYSERPAWLDPNRAIIADDSRIARQLACGLSLLGLSAGRDYDLAACDGSNETYVTMPQLARVSFQRYPLGRAAADMMLAVIKDAQCPSVMQQGQWVPGPTVRPSGRTQE